MTRYLFIYHAPRTLADAAAADPAEMDAVLGEWMAWAGTVADEMVDLGTPLAGGVRVTAAGASPSTREVVGYSIIDADTFECTGIGERAPAPDHTGGGGVEAHEAHPIPGI